MPPPTVDYVNTAFNRVSLKSSLDSIIPAPKRSRPTTNINPFASKASSFGSSIHNDNSCQDQPMMDEFRLSCSHSTASSAELVGGPEFDSTPGKWMPSS